MTSRWGAPSFQVIEHGDDVDLRLEIPWGWAALVFGLLALKAALELVGAIVRWSRR